MKNVDKLARELSDYFLKSFNHQGTEYHIIGVNYEISSHLKELAVDYIPVFICSSALNKVKTFIVLQIVDKIERRGF